MRFVLVDRVESFQPGVEIRAVKNVSLAEEYLADHFPGFPVLPGVLMLEALTQASAWLMRASTEFRYSTVLLKEAKAVKYNSFVKPGQALLLTSTVKKQSEMSWEFQGTGQVEGVTTVSARLELHQFNLAEQKQEFAANDAERVQFYRDLWRQVWKPDTASAT